MAKKNSHQSAGTTSQTHVVDPAAKFYEQSRRNREAYKKALSSTNHETSWSDDHLVERSHPMQQEGNPHSRSGFDYRRFRSKT